MNVDSLRSAGKEDEESAEVKIAKVAITNVMLWSVQEINNASNSTFFLVGFAFGLHMQLCAPCLSLDFQVF